MNIPILLNHDLEKAIGIVCPVDGKLMVDFLPEAKITKEKAFEIFGGAGLEIHEYTTENDNLYIRRARIIEFCLAYTQPVWEYEMRPAFETWCWVTDGKSVWIAKHAQHGAANGWTNEDTWEDFEKSVIAWIPLERPDIPDVIK